jgi:hypothetical protein
MTITLKEYLKGHRKVAHAAKLLCASVIALIAARFLKSEDHAALGEFFEYVFILLVALSFYQFYRAKKIARKEYMTAPPESLDVDGLKSVRRINFAAIGLIVVYFIMPVVLNGDGVDQKLDAGQGFDEVNYHASLSKAMAKMSKEQVEAYNWAVSDVDVRNFVARYGKSPTPRDVVIGEADAYIKSNKDKIVQLDKKLAGMTAEVQENDEKRAEALRLLKTVVPNVTYVGYSDESVKKRKESCTDIVCSKQGNDVYPPHIWYTIDNKNNLKLKSLPCTISYRANGSNLTYTKETDCLKDVTQANNGEYYILLHPDGKEDFSNGVATISFDYEKAAIPDPASNWRELNAMPDKLPELQQLEAAKRAIEVAESAKRTILR